MEALLMITPPPACNKYGMPALQHRKTEVRFAAIVWFQTPSAVSTGPASSPAQMLALLNSTSIPPKAAAPCANAASHAASSARAPLTGGALPHDCATACAVASAPGALMSQPTTAAPPAAHFNPVARQIPPPA